MQQVRSRTSDASSFHIESFGTVTNVPQKILCVLTKNRSVALRTLLYLRLCLTIIVVCAIIMTDL